MCDCIKKTNERMAEMGHRIAPAINFATGKALPVIVTEKLPGKRAQKVTLVASFCPFCGEAYDPGAAAKSEG